MVERVFVLMPAYNAGKTIGNVFARIPDEARRRITRYVVVNDGSRDDTADAIARLQHAWPTLVPLNHETNKGYGEAEKTLLRYALSEQANVGIVLHSDGQYSPEKIPELLEPFDRDTADIVQGSRMLASLTSRDQRERSIDTSGRNSLERTLPNPPVEASASRDRQRAVKAGALAGGMPLYKYVANKTLTMIENAAFGMKLAEYHSGYMLYSRKAIETLPWERLSNSFDFDLEMIVLAHVAKLRIAEIAIPTIYAGEKSHLNPIKYGFDVLSVVKKYRTGYYHSLF